MCTGPGRFGKFEKRDERYMEKTLGMRIGELRRARGLTQEEVAEKLGGLLPGGVQVGE